MKRLMDFLKRESLVMLVVALYGAAFALAPDRALAALTASLRTLWSVSLIIVSVFLALGLFGVLVDKQAIGRRLGRGSGIGSMLLAAAFGTVLVGPVYAVFPLLKAFKEHGARTAVIVTVITAWAVKIPMIPLEIRFLGWQFSLARAVLTIVAAIAMGLLFERLMGERLAPAASTAPTIALEPAEAE